MAEVDSSSSRARPDHVSRVYHELRRRIVWGQLPPGSRMAERIIASRLGLSRTPVRSALHRLQQEGFVSSDGEGGSREQRLIVAPLTQEDGRELFLIVGHLEGLAAHTAALLPPARRKSLARDLREINRALATVARTRSDVSRAFDLDLQFHAAYVDGVVGPRVSALHQAIKPQSERYTRLYLSVLLDELATSVKEHDVIVRAIADGDPQGAQQAVETNWRNAAERLSTAIGRQGERGSWPQWTPEKPPERAGATRKQSR